jgi:predicted double-glycine peptidase
MNLPGDVIVATGIMLVISLASAIGALFAARKCSPATSGLIAGSATLILAVHAIWLADNLVITRMLPLANAMFYGNPQGPAMGLLAGVAAVRMPGRLRRRMVLLVPLVAIGLWRITSPMIGHAPSILSPRWTDDVCRQSSTSSCSAAAAATLLASKNIPVTEAEMISACLTHAEGTSMLGLYRGLKLKCEGTNWIPIASWAHATDDATRLRLPAIVTIHLPGLPNGWRGIGNRHTIIVFQVLDNTRIDIGDPFSGRQTMSLDEFKRVWNGDAIWLGEKNPN